MSNKITGKQQLTRARADALARQLPKDGGGVDFELHIRYRSGGVPRSETLAAAHLLVSNGFAEFGATGTVVWLRLTAEGQESFGGGQ